MLLSVGGLSVLQEAVGDYIPVLLLGNKIDNEKEREVPRGLGEQLAKVKSKRFHLSGRGGTLRAVRPVPKSLGGSFLWKPPGKEASGQGGCPGIHHGNGPVPAHGELSVESHTSQDRVGRG